MKLFFKNIKKYKITFFLYLVLSKLNLYLESYFLKIIKKNAKYYKTVILFITSSVKKNTDIQKKLTSELFIKYFLLLINRNIAVL